MLGWKGRFHERRDRQASSTGRRRPGAAQPLSAVLPIPGQYHDAPHRTGR
jgi:hypothetical protein